MDSVLVTGASGFIGRRLTPALVAAGHRLLVLSHEDGDVADHATWERLPSVDAVVHLAARTFVPDSWAQPEAFLRTNVLGTAEVLSYCHAHGARLVFLSSYLYGDPAQLPIAEDSALSAQNPYALSKLLAETTCRFHAERLGVEVTAIRPFNVYGPGQEEPFLIPQIIRQLAGNDAIRVKDLAPRRDYVHVDDLVEAIVRAVRRRGGFAAINVGSGVSHSVGELIDAMQAVWGTRLPVTVDGERRRGEIMDTVADITAAERVLGWTPRITLRAGLEELRRLDGGGGAGVRTPA